MYTPRTLLAVVLVVGAAVSATGDHYHARPRKSEGSRSEATVDAAEYDAQYWMDEAQEGIEKRMRHEENPKRARNVVMFLGDGMSVPTLAAARTLLGQRRGATGEEAQLSFESFPTVGLVKTYCVDAQIADSACTATAYLCGVKNNEGTIGVTARVPRYGCDDSTDSTRHVESIAEWALADGRDAGIVTTTRITHASPAGAYAKVANRDWESDVDVVYDGHDATRCPDIAQQLITRNPGNQFKVILGGGRREFLPNGTVDEEGGLGKRLDDRNLIQEWQTDKASQNVTYQYVWNREQLLQASTSQPEYLLGLFENSHLMYHMQANPTTEPTLAELTEVAIDSLKRNDKGFFLFVESGRIDHAHHDNYVELALDETIQMSNAVTRAMELLSEEDSLIVVTADHAHVMAFNGYTQRGGDILGPSDERDADGVPYMTLSYTNGPGGRTQVNGVRPDVTVEETYRGLTWRSHVEIPVPLETHGGDDVAVFASGPHHEMFAGLYEQSQLPHVMAYAACIGPGRHACTSAAPAPAPAGASAALPFMLSSAALLILRFLHQY